MHRSGSAPVSPGRIDHRGWAGAPPHRLWRDEARDGQLIGYGYFAGQALIGPTLGNFTDLCQLPLAVFTLMLGLIERRRWLIAISAHLISDP